MAWALVFLVVGLLLLWRGADFLVSGAVGLAERMGISHLVMGLTVVAMGTSAPEVAAAVAAAVAGKGDIALGNVYGSNVANLALIGGVTALIHPLRVQASTLRREIPAMLAAAMLLWSVLRDLTVSRLDGILLLVIFAVLVAHTVRTARTKGAERQIEELHSAIEPAPTAGRDILYVLLGFVTLAIGARATVSGAVTLGSRIGLSDAVIGSTIVAIGTSLPELVTSVVAAVKGHHDISVGNLVGSNIFNTIFVTGVAGLVHPFAVGARFAGGADYWIMIGVSLAFVAAALAGGRTIRRPGGVVLLILYGVYLVYLLRSTGIS